MGRNQNVVWLPGTDVTAEQPDLIPRLEERCHPPGYTPFQAICLSRRVGKEFFRSSFFACEKYLVYHVRHDCPGLNRLHFAAREELVAFLEDRILPDRCHGIDLTITTLEMAAFLLTNHDGDIFYREPSEWTGSSDGSEHNSQQT